MQYNKPIGHRIFRIVHRDKEEKQILKNEYD